MANPGGVGQGNESGPISWHSHMFTLMEAYEENLFFFFRGFGIKIALDGILANMIQGKLFGYGITDLYDYESIYQSNQMRQLGHQPITSANFMNITTLSSVSNLLLNHSLFGKLLFR